LNSFTHIIANYIVSNSLLNKEHKYIVALSGGADSVALLHSLKVLGYAIEAAHCNFCLRGDESIRDENFCIALCRKLNIPLHRVHFDTKTYANLHHISIEMAARELRYNYFQQLAIDIQAAGICVAHHRNDSIETLLINLMRGTGIHGLAGIAPKNGIIIRPLLCISRTDILEYLQSIQQDYVTDSSNLIDDVQRNKIRLNVLPAMEKVTPAVYANIFKTTQYVREAVNLLDKILENKIVWQKEENCWSFSISEIHTEYELWFLLKGKGFASAQIDQIYNSLHSTSGKMWNAKEFELLIDREKLLLRKTSQQIDGINKKELLIPECGTYIYSRQIRLKFSIERVDASFVINKKANYAYLDASKVVFPLKVRPIINGDRFVPLGMEGSKLISDFLTDKKYSLFAKQRQLIIQDYTNKIIWVVNERPDNRVRVTPLTSTVLKIELLS